MNEDIQGAGASPPTPSLASSPPAPRQQQQQQQQQQDATFPAPHTKRKRSRVDSTGTAKAIPPHPLDDTPPSSAVELAEHNTEFPQTPGLPSSVPRVSKSGSSSVVGKKTSTRGVGGSSGRPLAKTPRRESGAPTAPETASAGPDHSVAPGDPSPDVPMEDVDRVREQSQAPVSGAAVGGGSESRRSRSVAGADGAGKEEEGRPCKLPRRLAEAVIRAEVEEGGQVQARVATDSSTTVSATATCPEDRGGFSQDPPPLQAGRAGAPLPYRPPAPSPAAPSPTSSSGRSSTMEAAVGPAGGSSYLGVARRSRTSESRLHSALGERRGESNDVGVGRSGATPAPRERASRAEDVGDVAGAEAWASEPRSFLASNGGGNVAVGEEIVGIRRGDVDAGEEVEGRVRGGARGHGGDEAEGFTSDDFQCNICWEMLARPVTLVCGHTACEACMAKYLRTQAHAQARLGNIRANRIACPAGCQRMIPLALPEVTTLIQKLLIKAFPQAYRARLEEANAESVLVTQVRRIAEEAAAESRRRRRRPVHPLGGVLGPGGGGGGVPDFIAFGNAPPDFIPGLRGQQNAARFRLDVAVPNGDFPPAVSRWYKRMGMCLFVFLCLSWQHQRAMGGNDLLQHPGLSFLRGAGRSQRAVRVADTGYSSSSSSSANGAICSVSGGGSAEDEDSEEGSGACASYEGPVKGATSATGFHGGEGRWLFSMELNLQEFVARNRWAALRSFYPLNNPWSSSLYLYFDDPILVTRPQRPASTQTPSASSSPSPLSSGAQRVPKEEAFSSKTSRNEEEGAVSIDDAVEFVGRKSTVDGPDTPPQTGDDGEVGTVDGYVEGYIAAETGAEEHGGNIDPFVPSGRAVRQSGVGVGEDDNAGDGEGGKPRRMFLEFYGPIVDFFLALGLPAWLSEVLTVVAAQLCPLIEVAPLLHLSTRTAGSAGSAAGVEVGLAGSTIDEVLSLDFSLDLVIYGVFKLLLLTLAFWRSKWRWLMWLRAQPRDRGARMWRVLLLSCAGFVAREFFKIKVLFPLVEHVVFGYLLQWPSRYLFAWAAISLRVGLMKLIWSRETGSAAPSRVNLLISMLKLNLMVMLVLSLFLPQGTLHSMETLWCHMFTHLLVGTRFYNTFFVGEAGGRRRQLAGRLARAMRHEEQAQGGDEVAMGRLFGVAPARQHRHQQQGGGVGGPAQDAAAVDGNRNDPAVLLPQRNRARNRGGGGGGGGDRDVGDDRPGVQRPANQAGGDGAAVPNAGGGGRLRGGLRGGLRGEELEGLLGGLPQAERERLVPAVIAAIGRMEGLWPRVPMAGGGVGGVGQAAAAREGGIARRGAGGAGVGAGAGDGDRGDGGLVLALAAVGAGGERLEGQEGAAALDVEGGDE